MKKKLISCLLAVMISSCACDFSQLDKPTIRQLAGNYDRGDGLGYNVSIKLDASGSYTAGWYGCMGDYGSARGRWNVSDSMITFSPIEETGMMKGHLRQLHIIRRDKDFVFVPDLKDDYYLKYGPDDFAAFHKRKPSP